MIEFAILNTMLRFLKSINDVSFFKVHLSLTFV
jgi:hypothetical protein